MKKFEKYETDLKIETQKFEQDDKNDDVVSFVKMQQDSKLEQCEIWFPPEEIEYEYQAKEIVIEKNKAKEDVDLKDKEKEKQIKEHCDKLKQLKINIDED